MNELYDKLLEIIDSSSIEDVLTNISNICNDKSDQIRKDKECLERSTGWTEIAHKIDNIILK